MNTHMPVVAVVSVIGIVTCAFALSGVLGNVQELDASTFSTLIIVIPCAIMVICSFIIMVTAHEIGRKLFLAVAGVCFAGGVVSMIVTSMWLGDPSVTSALLANSPDGATITVPVNSPIIVMRNIAAYIVCPTVGSIAGAWIGSRLHPVKAANGSGARARKGRRS